MFNLIYLFLLKLGRKPENVYHNMLQLLGRNITSLDDPFLQSLIKDQKLYWLNNAYISTEDDPTLLIKLNDKVSFTIEDIIAQLLRKAKGYASQHAETTINECSISVPSYFTHQQRKALINAAKIAGLSTVTLVDQGLAVAVSYSTDRVFEQPRKVLFFDLGSSDLQISAYEFQNEVKNNKTIKDVRFLARTWNTDVGVRQIDLRIAELWANEMVSKGLIKSVDDLTPKSYSKLLIEAKKAKEVLSANKDRHVYIENVVPDVDFKTVLTREKMDEVSQDIYDKVKLTLERFFENKNFTVNDIDEIQLFGAGTRVVQIQKLLKDFFGKDVNRQLNTDEACAIGTGLFAAEVSGTYRVPFRTKYGARSLYPIKVNRKSIVNEGGEEEDYSVVLFNQSNYYGAKRILKIPTDRNSVLKIFYDDEVNIEGFNNLLEQYTITGIEDIYNKYNVTGKPMLHLNIELTKGGVVKLNSAEGHIPVIRQKIIKVPKIVNETVTEEEEKSDENIKEESKEESVNNNEENNTDDQNKTTENEKETKKAPKIEFEEKIEEYKTNQIIKLKVESLNDDKIEYKRYRRGKQVLDNIDKEEAVRLETEKMKNNLEALLYSLNEHLIDPTIIEHSTEEEREGIRKSLSEISEWLSFEGAESTLEVYKDKTEEIAKLFEPINKRFEEKKKKELEKLKEKENEQRDEDEDEDDEDDENEKSLNEEVKRKEEEVKDEL